MPYIHIYIKKKKKESNYTAVQYLQKWENIANRNNQIDSFTLC